MTTVLPKRMASLSFIGADRPCKGCNRDSAILAQIGSGVTGELCLGEQAATKSFNSFTPARAKGDRVGSRLCGIFGWKIGCQQLRPSHSGPFLIALTESWKEDCKCYRSFSESDLKRIENTASCAISIDPSFLTIRD